MTVVGSVDIGEDVRLVAVDHNPTLVATNAPKGSMIIDVNGEWYRKIDDGATTNVELPIPGANDPTGLSVDGYEVAMTSVSAVSVAAGAMRDSTGVSPIVSSAPVAIDVTVSGAGGLDTGSEPASSWLATHMIADTTGVNPVSGIFSLSDTAPTMPAGYDVFRRVGWMRNDASSDFLLKEFRGSDRRRDVVYDESGLNVNPLFNGTALTFTDVDLSSFVPPTAQFVKMVGFFVNTAVGNLWGVRTNGGVTPLSVTTFRPGVLLTQSGSTYFECNTDASQLIEYFVGGGSSTLSLVVAGYQDLL